MVDTKRFKTKLCILYQSGRCGRQTCTFAHGSTELRRFSERQNNRGNDLRNRLDRKRSPLHRYSPKRDTRGWQVHQRYSPPRPIKKRKHRMHDDVNGQSDFSGSFKTSDVTGDLGKDDKLSPLDSKLEDELKQLEYEVDTLFDHKGQLKIELEERIQDADNLSSRIEVLEAQLSEEKDKFRRVNSKMKKLIRAHATHTRLKDELRRSEVQLEKLMEDTGLNATRLVAAEDNSNVDIISDDEGSDLKRDYAFARKQLHTGNKNSEVSDLAYSAKEQGIRIEGSCPRGTYVRSNGEREAEVENNRNESSRSQPNEGKSKRQRDTSKGFPLDKQKVLDLNIVAPPTSMAAHAVDDFIDQTEVEEKTEVVETPVVDNGLPLPSPPLSPISEIKNSQYEGDNGNVDGEGHDELEEVDIV